MSDEPSSEAPVPLPVKPDLPVAHPLVAGAWATARRRLAELLIVFFGVSAAFFLNRFETDRRDTQRRGQILAALEREGIGFAEELRSDIAQAEEFYADFDRRLAAGEMPPLSIWSTNSGYSTSDDAMLLQAGGLEVLDVDTVELLRNVNNLQRSLTAARHNQFEQSLMELTNHEQGDFYDPNTRQLRRRYAWYPPIQHQLIARAKVLLEAEEKLLQHLGRRRQAGVSPAPSPAAQTTPPHSPTASSPPA